MAESRDLPGWPKKRLVRDVRRHLWSYGIRPTSTKLWQETWAWANRIAKSYVYCSWPIPSEISAQYVVLLLLEMKANKNLKLPFRAMQHMSHAIRQTLGEHSLPMIELKTFDFEKTVESSAQNGSTPVEHKAPEQAGSSDP